MFWAVPDTSSSSFTDTFVAPLRGLVMVPVGAAVAGGVDAAVADGDDVTRADAGVVSAGDGAGVEVCAPGPAGPGWPAPRAAVRNR